MTQEQTERIKRYEGDIAKRNAEQIRRSEQDEFLRHSLRNSQKMRALKENAKAAAAAKTSEVNMAFTHDEGQEAARVDPKLIGITTSDLAGVLERLASDSGMQNLASTDPTTRNAIASLRGLLNDQRFQKSFQFAQKVSKNMYKSNVDLFLGLHKCFRILIREK